MSNAPPGWPVLAGEVFKTLGAVQTYSRARGRALKAGGVLAPVQVGALLPIDPNEVADPREFQE